MKLKTIASILLCAAVGRLDVLLDSPGVRPQSQFCPQLVQFHQTQRADCCALDSRLKIAGVIVWDLKVESAIVK
jgi:hypothetical protein